MIHYILERCFLVGSFFKETCDFRVIFYIHMYVRDVRRACWRRVRKWPYAQSTAPHCIAQAFLLCTRSPNCSVLFHVFLCTRVTHVHKNPAATYVRNVMYIGRRDVHCVQMLHGVLPQNIFRFQRFLLYSPSLVRMWSRMCHPLHIICDVITQTRNRISIFRNTP